MVVPGLADVAAGDGWSTSFGGDLSPWFPPLRFAHIVLVVGGVAAMLSPALVGENGGKSPSRRPDPAPHEHHMHQRIFAARTAAGILGLDPHAVTPQ